MLLTFHIRSSKVDGMKSRLETVRATKQLTKNLATVSKALGQSIEQMNLAQVEKILSKFDENFEDIDVMEKTVNDAMEAQTAKMIPTDEVDSLIKEVADEYSLSLNELLPEIAVSTGSKVSTQTKVGNQQQKVLN
eukprot:TRINITY_DN1537_c0_g1_i3.p1 TRINITY_DN1537_c0_g1~~TRINITY_DN1537_c0_g1_i3.p1  ORF type:complete len:135 (-),score=28.33 TRINITY_DN1537_c0_g1_i3:192-596(-)